MHLPNRQVYMKSLTKYVQNMYKKKDFHRSLRLFTAMAVSGQESNNAAFVTAEKGTPEVVIHDHENKLPVKTKGSGKKQRFGEGWFKIMNSSEAGITF